ncbi:hypothetical protein Y032_0842g2638 [Ancylostoma ceylanicum]|uniref:Uncharacterized protein n=1 Tax=Ancylostoma ceylanicum TaxID=53326 RepID=A0A016WBC8_9BILA|nr:hypothetical protein Y032_0842g2638 [Ancylostoma ceylanicum]
MQLICNNTAAKHKHFKYSNFGSSNLRIFEFLNNPEPSNFRIFEFSGTLEFPNTNKYSNYIRFSQNSTTKPASKCPPEIS